MSRKFFVLLAAAMSFSSVQAGLAADMPLKGPAYVPSATAFSWTGCYIGANAGGGWNASGWNDSDYNGNGIGAVAGGQAGCNYQINKFVFGAEGEFDWSGITNNASYSEPEPADPDYAGSYAYSYRTQNLWDATLALRAGFVPLENLLIYGKVGVAWGSYKLSYACCNYAGADALDNYSANAQTTATGLVVGAGFEYAITNHWTAKFEYEYIDYGSPSFNIAYTDAGVASSYSETLEQHKQIVKVGLNYKFDWAPGAKY